jgi:hypothetical protein
MGETIKIQEGGTVEVPWFGLIRIPWASQFGSKPAVAFAGGEFSQEEIIVLVDQRWMVATIYDEVEMSREGRIRMPVRKTRDILSALGIPEAQIVGYTV